MASALLILSGCASDDTEPSASAAAYGLRNIRIRLTDGDPDSRTTIVYPDGDRTSKVVWTDGDRVSCFISTDGGTTFSSATNAEVGAGGDVTLTGVPETSFIIRVRYPEVPEGSAWSEPVVLPEQRQALPDRFEGCNLPLSAEGVIGADAETIDLPYTALGSVIRLKLSAQTLTGERVRSLVLTDGDTPISDGSRSVTLAVDTPADLSAEHCYYCVVRPGTYDLTVSVETDAAVYYYNATFGSRDYKTGLHRFALVLDNVYKCRRTVAADGAGTANCYVLSGSGSYSFDASIPGNGVTPLRTVAEGLIEENETYDAAYLWTTGTDATAVVSDVRFDAMRRRICVTVPDPMIPGSVVVALYKPTTGRIVWTWHLWVNDTVADDACGSLRWMNQNLGATNPSGPGSDSYGFYYQFGRKDPEIGANAVGTKAGVTESAAFVDKTAPTTVNTALFGNVGWEYSATGVTLAESLLRPMRHSMRSLTDGNIAFTAEVDPKTVWGSGVASKTMYDPCPPGYKVPTAPQCTQIITTLKNSEEVKDATTNSRSYLVAGQRIWLPTPGYRLPTTAAIGVLGRTAHIWCTRGAGATNADAFTMRCTTSDGSWSRAAYIALASGATVRCIRIEED